MQYKQYAVLSTYYVMEYNNIYALDLLGRQLTAVGTHPVFSWYYIIHILCEYIQYTLSGLPKYFKLQMYYGWTQICYVQYVCKTETFSFGVLRWAHQQQSFVLWDSTYLFYRKLHNIICDKNTIILFEDYTHRTHILVVLRSNHSYRNPGV